MKQLNLKKISVVALSLASTFAITTFISSNNSHANELQQPTMVVLSEEDLPSEQSATENSLTGVKVIGPQLRETSKPSKAINVKKEPQGKYNFKGWSYGQWLYSNFLLYGDNNYVIVMDNYSDNPIKVSAKRDTLPWGTTYASTTVSGGKSTRLSFSGINSDTQFYLEFGSTNGRYYNFAGYIY